MAGDSAPSATQTSTNTLTNGTLQYVTNGVSSVEQIGGGRDDLILIGGASQVNQQGANAIQTGNDDNLLQHSLNMVNSRVILGGRVIARP